MSFEQFKQKCMLIFVLHIYRDETSRHHYYLQLRHNVLARGLLHACASEEVLYLLAGLALQADMGDYSDTHANSAYFQPQDYFPQQVDCKIYSRIMY